MDPYKAGKARGRSPSIKTGLAGRFVVILDTYRDSRELALIHPYSRCVLRGEVHELILTDEQRARPGGGVDRVAGIGFMVFETSGVVMVGDAVRVPGKGLLGTVVGFDESHLPNHFNIVLAAPERASGRKLGLALGDDVHFDGWFDWDSAPGLQGETNDV